MDITKHLPSGYESMDSNSRTQAYMSALKSALDELEKKIDDKETGLSVVMAKTVGDIMNRLKELEEARVVQRNLNSQLMDKTGLGKNKPKSSNWIASLIHLLWKKK